LIVPGIVPPNVLEQIRSANDIVEVIGTYFPLKRRGANFIALCPFHKEKTPSFNVNATKQIWHCFGCGTGGDVFKFVMQYENLGFTDAVRRLAERAGVTLEFDTAEGAPSRDEKDALFKLHELAATFFHQLLLKQSADGPAQAYLKKRGIGAETVKRWRLGYSPEAWDGLLQFAAQKKYPATLMAAAGLALARDSGGYYDRFRGRLMFPICDEQGRVVGFSGRILTDAKDQPKYVNSPETAIFQKGKILFGLDKAKKSILDETLAIICEGQIDTISCHENGFTNVVAPQGTAFTEQHARILKRHTDDVILMFDGDDAGQNAAARNAEPLWDLGVGIRVALLPEKHDPDSFLKQHGAVKLRELLDSAPGFFDFLLQRLSRQHDARTERGKVQIAEQMTPWLCRIRDPILQATFAQRTAARLEVREEVLRRKMKDFARHVTKPREEFTPTSEPEMEAPRPDGLPAELTLLQLVLGDERLLDMTAERIERDWLSDSLATDLLLRALELHGRGDWNGANSLLHDADEPENRLLSALLLQPALKGEPIRLAAGCLVTLERRWIESRCQQIRRRLAQPGCTPEDVMRLQKEALDLRRKLEHIPALLKNTSV
jgi:DNA primase